MQRTKPPFRADHVLGRRRACAGRAERAAAPLGREEVVQLLVETKRRDHLGGGRLRHRRVARAVHWRAFNRTQREATAASLA